MKKRPDWDSYFLEIANLVATRSTCRRRQVGAVLVRDKRILTTGYNGAPANLKHCLDVGCLREKQGIPSGQRQELCRGLHAEQNAMIQAALYGVPITGATIYVTCQPCVTCAKMLINCKVSRIVIAGDYPDEFARSILSEAGITVEKKEKKMKKILLFGKVGCALCEGWKRKLTHLAIPFAYYDIGTTEGMVEMAYNNIGRVPALLIGEKRFEEINPSEITSEELQKLIGAAKE